MSWTNRYLGLPWREKGETRDGVSCWGLPVLIYREELGLELPSYAEGFACSAERAEVAAIVAGATAGPAWHPVPPGAARDYDVAVFRIGGIECHVGLICGAGRMLHVTDGQDSAIADLRSGRWAHRLAGIHRHAALRETARD